MTAATPWRGLAALAALLALGCSAQPELTEIILTVDLAPRLAPMRDVASVDIQIVVRSDTVVDTRVPVPDRSGLPLTLGVRSASGQESPVQIDVTGNAPDATPLVARSVRTHFLHGERRVVQVVLDLDCAHVDCGSGLTCIAASCARDVVDPLTLPTYTGTLPDAGLVPVDAGMDAPAPRDAGTDARDAGPPDAPPDAGPTDAGRDAASCSPDAMVVGMPDGCVPRRPPARPSCGDQGDDGTTRTIALLDPILDQSAGRWATLSYDLDGLCTDPLVPGTPIECTTPLADPVRDGAGGTDNALGQIAYSSLLTFQPTYGMDVRSAGRSGHGLPVVRLTGWNGRDDDGRVRVTVATTIDVAPAGTTTPASMVTYPNGFADPAWDGTDIAFVGSNYYAGGMESVPLVLDDNAYVANRTLVAVLPPRAPFDIPARMSAPGVASIRLTDIHLIAHLSSDGTRFDDAVITGRWAYADVIGYLDALGICGGTPLTDMFIAAFSLLMQRSLDVRSTPGTGGPGVNCDALSAALPFATSSPVQWGGIAPANLVPATCP